MEGVKMRDLLKKGDVFVINRGVFAGKYVVSCVEENTISTMPTYESRVWCLQLGNLEKGICFNQSDGYKSPSTSLWTKGVPYLSPVIESLYQSWQTSVGDIKVIGHATRETPGKWNVKYFDKKKEPYEVTLKRKVDEVIAKVFTENTKDYGVKWNVTEKMGDQKADKDTSNLDWGQIFKDYSVKYGSPLQVYKDAIDNVIKEAIESTARKIIKEFSDGIKKVIGS